LLSAIAFDTPARMPRLKAPQRREQLIAVATKQFAKFGYDATTTDTIATAAGVTEPILYRHFGSKQELFVAITRSVSEQTVRHWHALIADVDGPAEQLREVARQFPAHLKQSADAYRVIHNALTTSRDRKVLAVLREHYRQIEAFFCGIITAGIDAGAFRKVDPRTPSWLLINTGLGFAVVTLNLSPFETFDVEDAVDHIIRTLVP
jgi:AcrR family transcriptional regulator